MMFDELHSLLLALDGLIGSVGTGHIRRGSDIDIHLFSPSEEPIAARLASLGWPYWREVASIRRGSEVCDYIHYQVELRFPLELTMYDPRDLRRVSRSSTDGKPIERVGPRALEALIARDHAAASTAKKTTKRRLVRGTACSTTRHRRSRRSRARRTIPPRHTILSPASRNLERPRLGGALRAMSSPE